MTADGIAGHSRPDGSLSRSISAPTAATAPTLSPTSSSTDNAGGDASGITVDVTTSGVATLGDQGAGVAGRSAAGFSCANRAPSGGETAAMRCTGGKLAKGQAGNPAVIVKFTGPGSGVIHAQISGGADTTNGNNGTALSVWIR
jgi:hypothetical protein